MLGEVGELSARWPYIVATLIPVAILVYWLGNFRLQRQLSARNTEPRGRREPRGRKRDDPQFSAMVGRMLQRGLVSPIATAPEGPVLIRGVLAAADGSLGGAPGRECVWRNRSGAGPDTAVSVEMVTVADATGRVTLENLATANVVAPEDRLGPHRSSCVLLLGDEVEVVGRLKHERFGQDPDPTRLIYGTLGADGSLHVRVCKREPTTQAALSESQAADPSARTPPGQPPPGQPPSGQPPSGTTTS